MTPAQHQARMQDRIARVLLANDRLIQQAAAKREGERALRLAAIAAEPPRSGKRSARR